MSSHALPFRIRFARFLVLLSGIVLAVSSNAQPPRPNVVLVVSDDQGYGDAGIYGSDNVETPTLDSIARRGVQFRSFRVNPLCAPTRSSILTGLYSLEAGMWRGPSAPGRDTETRPRRIHDEVKLLPQLLKDAGYATGIFGKWHLGYESPNTPNDRGFDEFYGFLSGAHPYHETPASPFLHNGKPYPTPLHSTDLFTDKAIEFIRANRDRPFFCYLPYNAVHGPLWSEDRPRPSGKPEWLAKYETAGVELPRRDYNAVLSHMDARVGDVLLTLRDLGLEERTLFIYVSDNGALIDKYPGDNSPLRGQKGQTYEGGIRVPAVMQWPGVIPPGTVSDADAAHFDLFTTILEAAGVSAPATNGGFAVSGVSLLPHLRSSGREPLARRTVFWDLFGKVAALEGDWKIVGELANHHGDFDAAARNIADARLELYRISSDVSETQNVASENEAVYRELKQKLIDWMKRMAAGKP